MMRSAISYVLLLMAAPLISNAQVVEWVHPLVGGGGQFAHGLDVADNGDVLVTGSFYGELNFGGTSLVGEGFGDGFVARYNSQNELVWAIDIGGDALDGAENSSLDPEGNLLVVGNTLGTVTLGAESVTSEGSFDAYIAKLGPDGTPIWLRGGNSAKLVSASAVAADDNGNVYVAGYFSGTVEFDGTELTTAGEHDIFLVSYDASGNLRWAKRAGGPGSDQAGSMAVSGAGDVYIAGFIHDNAQFGETTIDMVAANDAFVARYNADGNVQWAKNLRENSDNAGSGAMSIDIDAAGHVYVAGIYSGTVVFGSDEITSNGGVDLFVLKVDGNGEPLMLAGYGGSASEGAGTSEAVDIAAGTDGGFYLSAAFQGTVSLGSFDIESAGDNDVFTAGFDAEGTAKWVVPGNGTGLEGYCYVAVSSDGSVYVTTQYSGTTTIGEETLNPVTTLDLYLAKINPSGQLAPKLLLNVSEVDFGRVDLGESGDAELVVGSGASPELIVQNIAFSDPDAAAAAGFELLGPDNYPLTLSEGGEIVLLLEFSPTAAGNAEATVVVETNDPANPNVEVPVRGIGNDPASSVDEDATVQGISVAVHPNPVQNDGELTVTAAAGRMNVQLVDVQGRNAALLFDGYHNGGEQRVAIPVSELQSGAYICTVRSNGRTYSTIVTIVR